MLRMSDDMMRCTSLDCPKRGECLRNVTIKVDPPFSYYSYGDAYREGEECGIFIEAPPDMLDMMKGNR